MAESTATIGKISPTLYRTALDTLSIPVISVECERVFSSAKKLFLLQPGITCRRISSRPQSA
jgi:hypothetical protein